MNKSMITYWQGKEVEIVDFTKDDYLTKCSKEELVDMLLEANRIIEILESNSRGYFWVFKVRDEEGIQIITFHKTTQGAYEAMREYLLNEYELWRDSWYLNGRLMGAKDSIPNSHPVDSSQCEIYKMKLNV